MMRVDAELVAGAGGGDGGGDDEEMPDHDEL